MSKSGNRFSLPSLPFFGGVHFIFAIYYDCKRLFGQLYRTLSNLEKATKAAGGISR